MVSRTDERTNACVQELCHIHLQHQFITCNITVNLLEVSLHEQSFWHSTFCSCFPHFIKAFALAEACNSAENRRSRGFRRQPIRFFPQSHSANYFTHYAIPQSVNSRSSRPVERHCTCCQTLNDWPLCEIIRPNYR